MEQFNEFANRFGEVIWSMPLFVLLLGCGVIFSVFTKFVQFRVLTHGISVIRGKYDRPGDAGQINHFQALCAALSATIGLGNIAGVAVAVQLGGPGAVFWMWVVGFFGMAVKFVECGLATMFRDERDVPDPGAPALIERDAQEGTLEYAGEPPPPPTAKPRARGEVSGGPMWYIQKGLAEPARKKGRHTLYGLLKAFAILYAFVTFIASFGGGNSFQSWNVANILKPYAIPPALTGAVLAFFVGLVTIGGIKRIGNVAGKLVPAMCVIYVGGALYIILQNASRVSDVLGLIVRSAFNPAEARGAFLGTTVMVAFTWGLRRALFSNEAGQGSAAIAHAAAKTDEPVREGIVAGIGPFVDTLIICTMTAMVILFSGVHERRPIGTVRGVDGNRIYIKVNDDIPQAMRKATMEEIRQHPDVAIWKSVEQKPGKEPASVTAKVASVGGAAADNWLGATEIVARIPEVEDASADTTKAGDAIRPGAPVHLKLDGASMTRFAFDTGLYGFGKVMVTLGVLLFAFSTMISWSYYGEKGAEFLFGPSFILPYKLMFVSVIFLSCIIKQFSIVYNMGDALAGAQVLVNLPAALLLFPIYLTASRDYFRRLDSGQMRPV